MRTYDILNAAGDVVRTVEEEDTMRPTLLHGESLRLTRIDGEPAIPGEPLLSSDAERAQLPRLEQANADEPGEMGFAEAVHNEPVAQELPIASQDERPDDAHPGVQLPGSDLEPAVEAAPEPPVPEPAHDEPHE